MPASNSRPQLFCILLPNLLRLSLKIQCFSLEVPIALNLFCATKTVVLCASVHPSQKRSLSTAHPENSKSQTESTSQQAAGAAAQAACPLSI